MVMHTSYTSKSIIYALLSFFILYHCSTLGCSYYESVQLSIQDPKPGSMFDSSTPINVRVASSENNLSKILINGQAISGVHNKQHSFVSYQVPSVEGLGFVKAELQDDPYFVVRSWLQGTFIPPLAWSQNTMRLRITGDALNTGDTSIAQLLTSSLVNAELATFVDVLSIDLGVTTADIIIESAIIKAMDLELVINENTLSVNVNIAPLHIKYRIESGLIQTRGEGEYAHITVHADTDVSRQGVRFVQPQMIASKLVVQDDLLPSYLTDAVVDALDQEFEQLIKDALEAVTLAVTQQIFNQLNPVLRVNFPYPIRQVIDLTHVQVFQAGIHLHYQSQVAAEYSQVAQSRHSILMGTDFIAPTGYEALSVRFGARLLNQYAFAVWDAGNLNSLRYSRAQLESLGLGKLEFPYSQLKQAIIDLLLPPILIWDESGAWLELGGVTIDMKIDDSYNTKAWTAVRVPIKLVHMDRQLRLIPDGNRDITARDIMLNQLHILADRVEVLKLIKTALPNLVNDVFGKIPMINLPVLQLQGLPSSTPQNFTLKPNQVVTMNDHWRIQLQLTTGSVKTQDDNQKTMGFKNFK